MGTTASSRSHHRPFIRLLPRHSDVNSLFRRNKVIEALGRFGDGELHPLDPEFTIEGNRLLAELRAKGPLCRVEPLGSLEFLRWADCDAILRDFRAFSAEFARSQPVPGAEEETKIDTLLREDPPGTCGCVPSCNRPSRPSAWPRWNRIRGKLPASSLTTH
jgi:hypothetical protein